MQLGGWYDFGGTWDEEKRRWKPFGESISDIDGQENPMLRVGANATAVFMDRRSQYTQAELDFYQASAVAPGGTGIDAVFNGGNLGVNNILTNNQSSVNGTVSPFALDAMNAQTYDAYFNFKYQGFSFYNEWWLRDLNDFRGTPNTFAGGNNPILFSSVIKGASAASLFTKSELIDFGTTVSAGYFLIPHKLELAARLSLISGDSGDVNGDGTFTTVSATSLGIHTSGATTMIQGVAFQPVNTAPTGTTIRIVNGAFTHDNVSQEIEMGVNVFFYGERVKWQTDVGYYSGGNPAKNGQAAAGFINGVDGYEVRTQIQFAF